MARTYFSEDEKYIASLVGPAADDTMLSDAIQKSSAVLTNKRLYLNKKCIRFSGLIPTFSWIESVVNLEDITGTKVTLYNPVGYPILAFLTMIVFFFIYIEMGNPIWFLLGLLGAVIFSVFYFVFRRTCFKVDYIGGFMCFDLKHTALWDALEFSKIIHNMKDDSRKKLRCDTK